VANDFQRLLAGKCCPHHLLDILGVAYFQRIQTSHLAVIDPPESNPPCGAAIRFPGIFLKARLAGTRASLKAGQPSARALARIRHRHFD
jgi:hypothetical protein